MRITSQLRSCCRRRSSAHSGLTGRVQKTAHDYIEQYLRANPEDATELGDHRFDGQLTDYSPEARAKELATLKEVRDKLSAIDASQLTGANNIDFRILKENIDYEIFGVKS